MNTPAAASAHRRDQMLREAVARHTRVTLTTRAPDGWRLTTGTFQRLDADTQVWVRLTTVRDHETPTEFSPGQDVGLAFRRGHKKCLCHTVIKAITRFGGVDDIALDLPRQIQELQRRVFERTAVPPGRTIEVEVRPLLSTDNRRMAVIGTLDDISAGGVRVRVKTVEPLQPGAIYQCRFLPSPVCAGLTLDAVLRHAEAPANGKSSLGFQFIGLEASATGYEQLLNLARFVKSLQRSASGRQTHPPSAS